MKKQLGTPKRSKDKSALIGFLEKTPLYPFLISIYPVVYLLSENISEIGPEAGIRAALLFLLICILLYAFILVLVRDPGRSGLITFLAISTFFLIFFLIYAPAYHLLREVVVSGKALGRHRNLISFTIAILLFVILFAVFTTRRMSPSLIKTITLAGNSSLILLLLIPAITIIFSLVNENRNIAHSSENLPPIEQPLTGTAQNMPDIYYIILDMHTNDNVLSNLLDYDDTIFTDSLRQMGFYVSDCSQSNYPSTQMSITSSLNMDYIQTLSVSVDPPSLYPLMMDNRVRRSLEDIGYRTVAFETGYSFTEINDADVYLTTISSVWDLLLFPGVTPFESLILKVSGGKVLYDTRDALSKQMQVIIDAPYVQYRQRILFVLNSLADLPSEPGPKFVFAHILAPHDPFVFDADGSFLFRRTPFTLNGDKEFELYGWEGYSKAYVKELKYLHQVVLELVKKIIAESDSPPIILLQGDHGIPRTVVDNAQYEILNAYYIGGKGESALYNEISPVNSFRLIFNSEFNTNYQLLADQSYSFNKETGEYSPFLDPFPCP